MGADGQVVIDTRINSKGAEQGIKALEPKLKKIGKLIGFAFSAKMIMNFAKATKEAYNVQIEAETKLQTVLRARTKATNAQIKSIKELAREQQKIGVIGDEVQLSGAQQLATFVTETKTIETLLPAMNNLLAQQSGLNASTGDAVNIGNLMGKVLQGQTGALTRVGISFSEAEEQVLKYGTESEKASMLAKVIYNNVGDMNRALAQTDAGKQKQLANTMGDVKERFGQAFNTLSVLLIPALAKLANLANMVANGFVNVANAISQAFGGKTLKGVNSNADAVVALGSATDDATESTEGLAKAQKSLSKLDKLNVVSSPSSSGGGGSAGSSAGAGASAIADAVGVAGDVVEENSKKFSKFTELLEPLKNIDISPLVTSLKNLKSALANFGSKVGEGLKWFYDNVLVPLAKWTIEDLLPSFLDVLAGAINVLSAVIETAKPFLNYLWEFLKPIATFTGGVIVDVLNGIATALNWIAENEYAVAILTGLLGALATAKVAGELMSFFNTLPATIMSLEKSALAGDGFMALGASFGTTLCAGLMAGVVGYGIGKLIYNTFKDQIDTGIEDIMNYILDQDINHGAGDWSRFDDVMSIKDRLQGAGIDVTSEEGNKLMQIAVQAYDNAIAMGYGTADAVNFAIGSLGKYVDKFKDTYVKIDKYTNKNVPKINKQITSTGKTCTTAMLEQSKALGRSSDDWTSYTRTTQQTTDNYQTLTKNMFGNVTNAVGKAGNALVGLTNTQKDEFAKQSNHTATYTSNFSSSMSNAFVGTVDVAKVQMGNMKNAVGSGLDAVVGSINSDSNKKKWYDATWYLAQAGQNGALDKIAKSEDYGGSFKTKVASAVGNVGKSINTTENKNLWKNSGSNLANNLGTGAQEELENNDYGKGAKGKLRKGLWGLVDKIAEFNGDWNTSGGFLSEGLRDGIDKKWNNESNTGVIGRVINLAKTLTKALINAFSIGSPSKLWRDEIGVWLPLGIGAGIEKSENKLLATVGRLADDTTEEFNSQMSIPNLALGNVLPSNATFSKATKAGNNLVDNMVSALRQVMSDGSMRNTVVFRVEGDAEGIFKITQEQADAYARRTGLPAFN